jgi:hypothetical protein
MSGDPYRETHRPTVGSSTERTPPSQHPERPRSPSATSQASDDEADIPEMLLFSEREELRERAIRAHQRREQQQQLDHQDKSKHEGSSSSSPGAGGNHSTPTEAEGELSQERSLDFVAATYAGLAIALLIPVSVTIFVVVWGCATADSNIRRSIG